MHTHTLPAWFRDTPEVVNSNLHSMVVGRVTLLVFTVIVEDTPVPDILSRVAIIPGYFSGPFIVPTGLLLVNVIVFPDTSDGVEVFHSSI